LVPNRAATGGRTNNGGYGPYSRTYLKTGRTSDLPVSTPYLGNRNDYGMNDVAVGHYNNFEKSQMSEEQSFMNTNRSAFCQKFPFQDSRISTNPKKGQQIKPKVADRHSNFTKLGFPSTYQDANKNCIKNTVMDDADPHIENNELVKKTNHV
jgi:hypothetical protein